MKNNMMLTVSIFFLGTLIGLATGSCSWGNRTETEEVAIPLVEKVPDPIMVTATTAAGAPDPIMAILVERIDVEITAYCPCAVCCGEWGDGNYSNGDPVLLTDYSFALSPDLQKRMAFGESTLFIPGYNKPGTVSTYRDTTSKRLRSTIDVIMTVGEAHQRALEWGRKQMTLCIAEDDDMWLEAQP